MIVELFWRGLKSRNAQIRDVCFLTEIVCKFVKLFLHSLKKICLGAKELLKTSFCLFGRTAFTHMFTFKICYFITPNQRWHIYLKLHQIWAQSEKSAIASERMDCPRVEEVSVLLADSRWTRIWWREAYTLCSCSKEMQYCRRHLREASPPFVAYYCILNINTSI